MRVLAHVTRLDDKFGRFLVAIDCKCGHSRIAEPQALASLLGWTCTFKMLMARLRCSKCGKRGDCTVTAVAEQRPRVPKFPR